MSVSGLFSVTFSVIFAYVADITEEHERSTAYGLVRTSVSIIWCIDQLCVCVCVSGLSCCSLVSGFCDFRSKFSDESGYRSVPVCPVRRQSGGSARHYHRGGWYSVRPAGGARVSAGQNETVIMGFSHFLGTGGSFRCKLHIWCFNILSLIEGAFSFDVQDSLIYCRNLHLK